MAHIEMSLSAVLIGESWANDGDFDEPDGGRPDERITRSGREQVSERSNQLNRNLYNFTTIVHF